VPYRLIPRTSPSACLKAVPRAIAESCVSASRSAYVRERGRGAGRIGSVVVINPEITLGLERERHAAVLCERGVHLRKPWMRV
jgi:hypothetical protein